MSIFNEEVSLKAKAVFSDWIQIKDDFNKFTIEDFSYTTGVTQNVIGKHHCVTCTAVNQCWFKNENNKKPVEFDYANYTTRQISFDKRGLYHPNCHCKKIGISSPKADDIKLIIPEGKIWWLFNDKRSWVHSMGYIGNEEEKILEEIYSQTKKAFVAGKYKLNNLDEKGFKITLFIEIHGINHALNQTFELKNGFSIFPNGKLKANTLLGGKEE